MGNGQNGTIEKNQDLDNLCQNTWYLGIEKEVSKMGYQLNVRSDPHHKINFRKLYSLPKPNYEEIVTLTTNDSLFSTEFENFRKSKQTLDPSQEYFTTTLINETKPQLIDFEKQVLLQLSTLDGCLLDTFKFFRSTKLPNNSKDQDTMIIKFRDCFVQILIEYYDLNLFARIYGCKFLNRLSLQCLVTNMIFNEEISSIVYSTRKQEQISKNEQLHIKITQSKEKTLSEFGISIKYCLDKSTREYIQSKRSTKVQNISQIQNKNEYEPVTIEQVDCSQIPSRPSTKLLQGTFFKQSPFDQAIEALNLIQFRITPHHKVKQLRVCFLAIYKAIKDYYNQFAVEPSNMSTDEMITIFHYILTRSKLQNPFTHFDIMQKYFGNLDGVEGIYLAIMEAALTIL